MKPWREVAVPHQDVLKGTFQESEFAADITQVLQKRATPEYQDARQFFARTYVTEGMALLLDSVVRRLSGQAGDPVIQLQTAFGGGKTHTLLAVYHLARQEYPPSELAGMAPILDAAGITELRKATPAVIDGINLAPTQAKHHDDIECHTLWGEMAYQLGRADGYALFADADASGTSPDKDTVVTLLERSAPCVILMDELVAFYRQFEPGKRYPAGSVESNLTFMQVLTEALKSVPGALLLASLPDSRNAGEGRGQAVLAELEAVFGRIQKIWKPVTKDEAFHIVRRRLFERIAEPAAAEETCRRFVDYYVDHAADFPPETGEARYRERLAEAYPVHPEIFDRLYEDWSTLPNFQRTRGVLQLLAEVVFRLWKDGNTDPMILPGALPLYNMTVRNKCLDHLPGGWDAVIDQDIDGEHSRPARIESKEAHIGKIQGARRVARTLFLGSAPGSAAGAATRTHRGMGIANVLLGAALPGQSVGHYQDALNRLLDELNYISQGNGRYWFDVTPNLRREAESRKARFSIKRDVQPLLSGQLNSGFARNHGFAGIHVFTPSADVPDEYGLAPRLVVLPPDAAYRKGVDNPAERAAEAIMKSRGDQPRCKANRLLFLAPDFDAVMRLNEQGRSYLAWNSIVDDVRAGHLNLDTLRLREAKKQAEDSTATLRRSLRDTYRWLMSPVQEVHHGKLGKRIVWEAATVAASAPNLTKEIESKLHENGWLITEWSPFHLKDMLDKWYYKDGVVEVGALKIWQDTCCYPYLSRLRDDGVFRRALADGVESGDFFGYASGKEGSDYVGFALGKPVHAVIDDTALIIELETARKVQERLAKTMAKPETSGAEPPPVDPKGSGKPGTGKASDPAGTAPTTPKKRRFYGTVGLDPVKAKLAFAQIVDEIIEPFTTRVGVDVKISVEIQATAHDGFDEAVQRIVKENSRVIKFGSAEFEEE